VATGLVIQDADGLEVMVFWKMVLMVYYGKAYCIQAVLDIALHCGVVEVQNGRQAR
jgi:hypothetical protein